MTDICERGQQCEEEMRSDALAAQARRAGLAGKTVEDSATHCHICEDEIPEERRIKNPGVQTCVPCQTDLERGLR